MNVHYEGWTGHYNLGDEICSRLCMGYIRNKLPNINISTHLYEQNCHYAICGGGTLLCPMGTLTSDTLFLDYANKGIPYSIVGTSLDGLDETSTKLGWTLTQKSTSDLNKIITSSEVVGVRDRKTLSILNHLNIDDSNINIVGDISFLEYNKSDTYKPSSIKNIGINVGTSSTRIYGFDEPNLQDNIVKLINTLSDRGYSVYMLCVWPSDLDTQNKIYKRVNKKNVYSIENVPQRLNDWKTLIDKYNINMVIGMKLHAIICSILLNVPSISISYREKCHAIMELLGLNDYYVKTDDKNIYSSILTIMNKLESENYYNKYVDNLLMYKNNLVCTMDKIVNSIKDRI